MGPSVQRSNPDSEKLLADQSLCGLQAIRTMLLLGVTQKMTMTAAPPCHQTSHLGLPTCWL